MALTYTQGELDEARWLCNRYYENVCARSMGKPEVPMTSSNPRLGKLLERMLAARGYYERTVLHEDGAYHAYTFYCG